ncbi:Inorganic pyrophosphatase [Astathelohania contejeani]|uniref:inorganic diphosphatase n=1 Tax=Astathelohania contejeani TaxID=164912 RepID=A0ABQ7I1W7_9MICR|nr:Inorganic pyrophosphatase [Thelohania contejeani]
MEKYSVKEVGSKYSSNYMVYVVKEHDIISPLHDIPLYFNKHSGIITVVNEIPRFENGKFEISLKKAMNPIIHDSKNEIPRFVPNIFPAKGYPWNYGALPQTWEDPNKKDPIAGEFGDNDPLDVIEIGNRRKYIGEVYTAKVLGCLGMLDGGECDWKIVVIDTEDPIANHVDDINDVDIKFPELLKFSHKWFRDYKIPEGKPENKFLYDGKFMNKELAFKVIRECHENWKSLISQNIGEGINKMTKNECGLKVKDLGMKESDTKPPHSVWEYSYI